MQNWNLEKKLKSEDGRRNVEMCVSSDGKLFRYYEHLWIPVGEEELLYYPDGGYWICEQMSGYFSNLEECERGARADLRWLSGAS